MKEIKLSARKRELAYLIKRNYKSCQICSIMNIKRSTLISYRKDIYDKFGVNNKKELLKVLKNYQIEVQA